MVDAREEGLRPDTRCVGQHRDDLRHRPADIYRPQCDVEFQPEGTDHLRNPSLGNAAQHFHLTEPQMRMHDAKPNREVRQAFGRDEGDRMLIPSDIHRRAYRRIIEREVGQPLIQGSRFRGRQTRCPPYEADQSGDAAHTVNG